MLKFTFFVLTMVAAVGITALTSPKSHGDGPAPAQTAPPSLPTSAASEPITGSPAVNAPGSETSRHDPFTPYGIGDPARAWKYSDLTQPEQAQFTRDTSTTGWDKVHAAFNVGIVDSAHQAASASAAAQLGIASLGSTGVVP